MDRRIDNLEPRPRRDGRRWIVIPTIALAATLLLIWGVVHRQGPDRSATAPIATRHRNARPGVAYVGDLVCARCHSEIAETYRQHPMGRSMVSIDQGPVDLVKATDTQPLFPSQGADFGVDRRDGRTFHQESWRDGEGKTIGQVDGEVRYVLGSGTRAFAFLIQRDDYLFQSPLTWYAQGKRWGLAPSFEGRDAKFDRQIAPGCLVCHANRFDHIEGTEGRYRLPIFKGLSIGCERCHGPGELHVRDPNRMPFDPLALVQQESTIVNSAKLETDLREDVCRQCHLLGSAVIAKPGRELTDFRPGLPLRKFVDIFIKADDESADHPNADHVEQMERSRCYRKSEGALGCISCHNPHERLEGEAATAHFRERCLKCHAEKGCAEPEASRRKQVKDDSCVACHMPKGATSDVPHVSTTLHSIPRNGKQALAEIAERAKFADPLDDLRLVLFHRSVLTYEELKEADRSLGVALRTKGRPGAVLALPLLEAALARRPDDLLAIESKGFALWGQGRDREALDVFERVLRQEPGRESTLEAAALVSSRLRRHEQAVVYWEKAIAVDPWRSSFRAELAHDLTRLQRWDEASKAARQCLALNPADTTARTALVLSTLRLGSLEKARQEFELFLKFKPPDPEALIRWFESLR